VPRKIFVAGEILTASDVNTNLADQAVMVFDDAAARDTAIPSPIEGMVVYLKDTDAVLSYSGAAWVPAVNTASIVDANVTSAKLGAGTILQVVSTTKTDTFSESVTSQASAAITGLTASITPRSTNSKVLVMVSCSVAQANDLLPSIVLKRDSTIIGVGDAEGVRSQVTSSAFIGGTSGVGPLNMVFLDSPSLASSISYGVDVFNNSGSTRTITVNRTILDSNVAFQVRTISTITVMEVAG